MYSRLSVSLFLSKQTFYCSFLKHVFSVLTYHCVFENVAPGRLILSFRKTDRHKLCVVNVINNISLYGALPLDWQPPLITYSTFQRHFFMSSINQFIMKHTVYYMDESKAVFQLLFFKDWLFSYNIAFVHMPFFSVRNICVSHKLWLCQCCYCFFVYLNR